jgi:hypothetical protein
MLKYVMKMNLDPWLMTTFSRILIVLRLLPYGEIWACLVSPPHLLTSFTTSGIFTLRKRYTIVAWS